MPPPLRILFRDEGPVGQLGAAPRAVDREGVLAVDLPAGVLAAKHVEAEARPPALLVLLDGAEHARAAIPGEAGLPPILGLGDDGGDPGAAPRALAQVLHGLLVLRVVFAPHRHRVREVAEDDAVGALVVVDQPLPMPAADRQWLKAIGVHDWDRAHRGFVHTTSFVISGSTTRSEILTYPWRSSRGASVAALKEIPSIRPERFIRNHSAARGGPFSSSSSMKSWMSSRPPGRNAYHSLPSRSAKDDSATALSRYDISTTS